MLLKGATVNIIHNGRSNQNPHHDKAIYNHMTDTFENLMEMIKTWAAEVDEGDGNFWSFGGQWGSWWSAGGGEEEGGRPQGPPLGGSPGRSGRSVSGNRPYISVFHLVTKHPAVVMAVNLGPLSLTWFNLNTSIDKGLHAL